LCKDIVEICHEILHGEHREHYGILIIQMQLVALLDVETSGTSEVRYTKIGLKRTHEAFQ
jgi:hypothetical protein